MKHVLALLVVLASATTAMASAEITCKKTNQAPAQGYEAVINGMNAELYLKGEKVAELQLLLTQPKSPVGGDQKVTTHYSQNIANGYTLDVTTGGLAGMTSATVFHGGFAGLTLQVVLNDCFYQYSN